MRVFTRSRLMCVLLLATLLLGIVAGGFSPFSVPQPLSVGDSTVPTDIDPNSQFHGIMPTPVANTTLLNWFIEQIPSNYSVLTQNQIGSKLGERLPNVWTFYQNNYNNAKFSPDAILIDYNLPGSCAACLSQFSASGDYYLFTSYDEGGIYLYFKNSSPSATQSFL